MNGRAWGGELVAEFGALTPARDPLAEHWRHLFHLGEMPEVAVWHRVHLLDLVAARGIGPDLLRAAVGG